MPRSRRPTQSDIARAAGVSPAVVSLVINDRTDGKIRISKETQARVREAIRTLGYVPNMAARQLAGGRNHLLGVFTYESAFPLNVNSFYYPFLVGIEDQAEVLGFDLLLFTRTADGNGQRQVYRDGINALQAADGAVLLGTNEDRDELARLHREGFPFVFVGRREIDGEPTAYVGADYEAAAAEVIEHLVDLGHTGILYIADQYNSSESAIDRENGVRAGLRNANLPIRDDRIFHARMSSIAAEQIGAWLEDGVTAIVTQSLHIARTIIHEAAYLKLRVPHDLSVAALGNSNENIVDDGSVTTLQIPRREMGAGAVHLLVKMLYHPDDVISKQILLPCTVVHGDTVGHPSR
jgi:DNA-binding LacI/PurR family transcriptional regulator